MATTMLFIEPRGLPVWSGDNPPSVSSYIKRVRGRRGLRPAGYGGHATFGSLPDVAISVRAPLATAFLILSSLKEGLTFPRQTSFR